VTLEQASGRVEEGRAGECKGGGRLHRLDPRGMGGGLGLNKPGEPRTSPKLLLAKAGALERWQRG
jgi:hypothetical protein